MTDFWPNIFYSSKINIRTYIFRNLLIYFFGGEILKGFSFAMIIGVIIGTYSSIFVATPILNYSKVSQKSVLKGEDKNT